MAEKVETSEQTPLKTDVDPVDSGAAADVEAGAAPAEPEKKKKGFFSLKFKKTESTAPVETKEGEEPVKKKGWFSRRCEKSEKEQQPSFGLDLINRDEHGLQTAIDLGFTDIFGEPDAVHSINGVWKLTNSVFNTVRCVVYKLVTLFFAIPLAIIFAVLFGIISALQVLVLVPVGRLFQIPAGWLFNAWSFVISNVFDPIARSIGLVFSNFNIRKYGINSEVTQPIAA